MCEEDERSDQGYSCVCAEGLRGKNCDSKISTCPGKESHPAVHYFRKSVIEFQREKKKAVDDDFSFVHKVWQK